MLSSADAAGAAVASALEINRRAASLARCVPTCSLKHSKQCFGYLLSGKHLPVRKMRKRARVCRGQKQRPPGHDHRDGAGRRRWTASSAPAPVIEEKAKAMRHAVDRTDRVSSLSKEIWSGASFYVDLSKFQYFGLPLDYPTKTGNTPRPTSRSMGSGGSGSAYYGTMLTLRNRAAPETDQRPIYVRPTILRTPTNHIVGGF